MAETVASLQAVIGADIGGFQKGVKQVNSGLGSIAATARSVGGVLGGLFPAALFGIAIKEAGEMQAQVAQLGAVLKSTKGIAGVTEKSVLELASALQKSTRYSDDQVVAVQNMLLTFTKIGKGVFPEATKAVLNIATAMGTDTKSAAIQLGKALNNPIEGITALTRVGVTFTAKQKQQIRYFQQTGQLAKAQAVILKELETEFGNSAEAAGKTFPGMMDRFKNSLLDVAETVGTALLPTLQSFLDFGIGLVAGIGQIDPGLISLAAGFALIAAAAGPVGALIAGILSPIGLIAGAVIAAKLAFDNNFLGIRDTVNNVYTAIKPVLDTMGRVIRDVFNSIFNPNIQVAPVAFTQPAQIKTAGLFDGLVNAVTEAGKQITALWDSIWSNNVLSTIGGAITRIFNAITTADWGGALKTVGGLIQSGWDAIWGTPLGQAVGNAITGVFTLLQSADWGGAINAVRMGIETAWAGIFGPEGFFFAIVPAAIQKVFDFVMGAVETAKNVFGTIASAITGALAPIITTINEILLKIEQLTNVTIPTSIGSAVGAVETIKGRGTPAVQPSPFSLPVPKARAGGGAVMPGGNYTVGENGPEFLRMGSRGGYVTPMARGGRGGNTTIIINESRDPQKTLGAVNRALKAKNVAPLGGG